MIDRDRTFMARALRLAARGMYSTRPNPRVGCVLVKNSTIIGEGWHEEAGKGHAEVNAIVSATTETSGSTAYVTLEPCAFSGRTGPCCEALVNAGVTRVVACMEDPHPRVAGKGFAYLRAKGVEVISPLLESDAAQLNPGSLMRHNRGRPFVRCKLAMSLDGRTALANGTSQWITGAAARSDVQTLRARSCAIVTGIGTLLADNPRLTIRADQLRIPRPELALRHPPARVILDSHLRTPLTARTLEEPGQVLIVHARDTAAVEEARRRFHELDVQLFACSAESDGRLDLAQVLKLLGQQEYNELLFEAGPDLAGSLVQAGLVDELIVYMSPRLLGDSGLPLLKLPEFSRMDESIEMSCGDIRQVGKDMRITLIPEIQAGRSD